MSIRMNGLPIQKTYWVIPDRVNISARMGKEGEIRSIIRPVPAEIHIRKRRRGYCMPAAFA